MAHRQQEHLEASRRGGGHLRTQLLPPLGVRDNREKWCHLSAGGRAIGRTENHGDGWQRGWKWVLEAPERT